MTILNVLAGTLTLGAYVPYVFSIVRGRTVPNRVSWWIWSVIGLLLLLTYRGLGGSSGEGVAVAAFLGQVVIALLSIRFGRGGATAIDGLCLAGACLSVFLWYILSSAAIPHLLILTVDLFAWLPTFRKVLDRPESEDLLAWFLWWAGATVALAMSLTAGGWDLPYPFYIFVTDGAIMVILGIRGVRGRNWLKLRN